MFSGLGKVAAITVESAKIVMRLHVRWIRFQYDFKLGNSFICLAPLCQNPCQIVSGTNEVGVELYGGIKFVESFLCPSSAIQNNAQYVVSCGRSWRGRNGCLSRTLRIRQRISLQS